MEDGRGIPQTLERIPQTLRYDMSFLCRHEHEKEFWQALFQFNTHTRVDGRNLGLVCYNVPNPWQPMIPISKPIMRTCTRWVRSISLGW